MRLKASLLFSFIITLLVCGFIHYDTLKKDYWQNPKHNGADCVKQKENHATRRGLLFVVSACSGAGKTTLVGKAIAQLAKEHPLERVITYTSRWPRPGEVNGRDYHFISQQEFEEKIQQGFFVEWSNSYGAHYGSACSDLKKLEQGISLIIILDPHGFKTILNALSNEKIIGIWITVPSLEVLKTRLAQRHSETEAQQAHRLALAQKELQDHEVLSLFKHKIINDVEEDALRKLLDHIRLELYHAQEC